MTSRSDTRSPCIERFAEYYRRLGDHFQVVDGTLWLETDRMISPVGVANVPYALSDDTARHLLSSSRKALLIRYTDGFDFTRTGGQWYSVICRKFVELSQCNSKNRSEIKKGLDRCVVEKVDAEHVAQFGYDVHVAARSRYEKSTRMRAKSVDRFRAGILAAKDFEDIMDFWAVRHDGVMVGYARVDLLGTTEASFFSITYHPAFFKKCFPSHALIYTINEYYLRQKSFAYVNDGFRSVWHPTGFQRFLVQHFAFEHAYTNLYLHYRPWVSAVLAMPDPAKRFASRFSSRFAALCRLDAAKTRDNPAKQALTE
jgi:hypothetical protein